MLKEVIILSILQKSVEFNTQIKYYNDPRIHNFGNTGFGGKIHSYFADYATKLIDKKRYNSINLRQTILSIHNEHYYKTHNTFPKIIDLCCGIGISTLPNHIGIDTSKEMINMANILQTKNNRLTIDKDLKTQTIFTYGNAENFGNKNEYTTASIMFAFHEMPNYAHNKIIKNAKRITTNDIIIADLSPNYKPSKLMLYGEPYLLNYKSTISNILKKHDFEYFELIPNHVGIWYYKHTY